jgi:uncharacterized protein (TIGR02996 family)
MSDQGFRDAIQENPDDDTPRLIYADWLDERNGPGDAARAEFIRVQCELARLPEWDERRTALEARERILWKKHAKLWCQPLRPFSRKFEFRRGFPDQVLVQGQVFVEHADTVLDAAPVFSIRLRSAKEHVEALARSSALSRLTSFSLYFNHIGLRRAQVLFASPHLGRLTELDLRHNHIRPGGLAALYEANLSRLTSLDLTHNQLGDGSAELLTRPGWPRLKHLNLSHNDLPDSTAVALAAAPVLSGLESLDLSGNSIAEGGIAALVASPLLSGLKRLTLSDLTPGGARALAGSRALAALTSLDARSTEDGGNELVRLLASAPGFEKLAELRLAVGEVSEASWKAFLGSALLARLATLEITPAAGLARFPFTVPGRNRLQGLRQLRLRRQDVGDTGAARLAKVAWTDLHELTLTSCTIRGPGCAALARSPHLARLRVLNLGGNKIGDEGARALAASPYLGGLWHLTVTTDRIRPLGEYVGRDSAAALRERFSPEVCPLS